MALKDRLQARQQGDGKQPDAERGLSVLDGTRREPERPFETKPAPTRPAGISPALAAAKNAIHALLVERHADEVDITERSGLRRRIDGLVEEYIKGSGVAFNRLDYGYLVDALLD